MNLIMFGNIMIAMVDDEVSGAIVSTDKKKNDGYLVELLEELEVSLEDLNFINMNRDSGNPFSREMGIVVEQYHHEYRGQTNVSVVVKESPEETTVTVYTDNGICYCHTRSDYGDLALWVRAVAVYWALTQGVTEVRVSKIHTSSKTLVPEYVEDQNGIEITTATESNEKEEFIDLFTKVYDTTKEAYEFKKTEP